MMPSCIYADDLGSLLYNIQSSLAEVAATNSPPQKKPPLGFFPSALGTSEWISFFRRLGDVSVPRWTRCAFRSPGRVIDFDPTRSSKKPPPAKPCCSASGQTQAQGRSLHACTTALSVFPIPPQRFAEMIRPQRPQPRGLPQCLRLHAQHPLVAIESGIRSLRVRLGALLIVCGAAAVIGP
jgi:hypothetical protein